jgi:hypothetical protein
MKLLNITKAISAFAVSTGVSIIVRNIILATTPKDTKPIAKAFIGIGGFVLVNLIADKVVDYVMETVDNIIEEIKWAKVENAKPIDLEEFAKKAKAAKEDLNAKTTGKG